MHFATNNKEKYLYDKINKKVYAFDFCYNNRIIEFQGDYYHCNPKKYKKTYYHNQKKKFASEIWKFDEEKKQFALSNNYEYKTVWQDDFKKNPEQTLKECIIFLNK